MSKNTIINLVLAAVLAGAGWFGIKPAAGGIFDLRGRIEAKKETTRLQEEIVGKLNGASQLLSSNQEAIAKLEQALPGAVQLPELITVMDNLASQNGLALGELNIVVPREEPRGRGGEVAEPSGAAVKTVKLNFKANGTYSAFKSWLKAVESNLLLMDVERISFGIVEKKTAGGEVLSNTNPVIDFVVSVDTYVLKN